MHCITLMFKKYYKVIDEIITVYKTMQSKLMVVEQGTIMPLIFITVYAFIYL